MGINPSRKEGIKKMEVAANESAWAWIEAMSILSITYQFFDLNKEKGLLTSQTVSKKFPDNFGYGLYYALGLMQNGKIDEAKKKLYMFQKLNSLPKQPVNDLAIEKLKQIRND